MKNYIDIIRVMEMGDIKIVKGNKRSIETFLTRERKRTGFNFKFVDMNGTFYVGKCLPK